ncbi:acyl-phosphate glycerol-3-phosphate acyltransferase [Jannaschia sp. CCS1]|uniref:Glycerol-3-phosphate acyltransferase n=1 Tax=Jannaschia sp. (strain CCS1) TaxID=290400 RepID=PLSY_JANSC|nr:RecName: Full=Glycerol-3-phosphate acyltransferase; AltName: Full=Acyl-PO4 G3P acyltransferase; AltName: Full=Acyl-phosphate--glycerol-3-phosphate acyltransferase; AltName: Full=G3P acyltransferase; Short=GPAT; AltName: Full=Lysophosphatidic acid synthase; Short=LPA synthase [Jannaschia sp. CCS1]ABD56823.1 acyl-phosphate glycerol-3-phosphate acyltransferase [Jannaschia sp. CCS1]
MIPLIETSALLLGLTALLAYLLGSVPFGIMMARLFGLGDLRSVGSGNIGATNVLRTGNKLAAFLTLVLDAGKGAIAVFLARALLGEDAAQLAGFAAFLGHCFPVFLGFKGGKGVATFLGTLLALAWPIGLAACAIWAITAAVFRMSSLAALVAAALSPLAAFTLGLPSAVVFCAALATLIFLRHRGNISRIAKGQEPKIGKTS